MTTYDGKCASFVPGREVVNKEPAVSKFMVEKNYRIHRERIMNIGTVLDTHVVVPDFMKNQSWKKSAAKHRATMLALDNELFYQRLSKVENEESKYTRENKEHIQKVHAQLRHTRRLQDGTRMRRVMYIQRENEYFLQRLQRTKPTHTLQSLKDWYRRHTKFKNSRRSDPTAGHIMTNMDDYLPPPLPPIEAPLSSSEGIRKTASGTQRIQHSQSRFSADGGEAFSTGAPMDSTIDSNEMYINAIESDAGGGDSKRSLSLTQPTGSVNGKDGSVASGRSPQGPRRKSAGAVLKPLTRGSSFEGADSSTAKSSRRRSGEKKSTTSSVGGSRKKNAALDAGSTVSSIGGDSLTAEVPAADAAAVDKRSNDYGSGDAAEEGDVQVVLARRVLPLPMKKSDQKSDPKPPFSQQPSAARTRSEHSAEPVNPTCTIHVLYPRSTGGNMTIKVVASELDAALALETDLEPVGRRASFMDRVMSRRGSADSVGGTSKSNMLRRKNSNSLAPKMVTVTERIISVQEARDIIRTADEFSEHVSISNLKGDEDMTDKDLFELRAKLIDMFKEVDDDGNGFLTFDEFQALMKKVDLGISDQELQFVISEADDNDNGVVDYNEFVPLAVDMIQSFRARNRAKAMIHGQAVTVDDSTLREIAAEELKVIEQYCVRQFELLDEKHGGSVKQADLKKVLQRAVDIGLNENEVQMILQFLPKDPFGRYVYAQFRECLDSVRVKTMRESALKSKGSDLQKMLLDAFQKEEIRLKSDAFDSAGSSTNLRKSALQSKTATTVGILPFRNLSTILPAASGLPLSKLQVMVIMSTAEVIDGNVNYLNFIPIVANTIELMFDPRALRQRAELIETTDLSTDALLSGMNEEAFQQRMKTLFSSYDIDRSGSLDQREFMLCLRSLDLELSEAEMAALYVSADANNSGDVAYDEFVEFFTHNLLVLEREKHIRLLQQKIHESCDSYDNLSAGTSNATSQQQIDELVGHLLNICKLADTECCGFLSYGELEELIRTMEIDLSNFQLDVIFSELETDVHGRFDYREFIPICAKILQTFRARETAQAVRKRREEWAAEKAQKMVEASRHEISMIVKFIKDRVILVENTIPDFTQRLTTIQDLLRNPQSGLNRHEANAIILKFFTPEALHHHARHGHHNSRPSSKVAEGGGGGEHHNAHEHAHEHPPHSNRSSFIGKGPSRSSTEKQIINLGGPSKRHLFQANDGLNAQELFEAVADVRLASIMRGLLDELEPEAIRTKLFGALVQEAEAVQKEQGLPTRPTALHSDRVLEATLKADLRLHRVQAMGVISWAVDCYDESGENINIAHFAQYASNVIAFINCEEGVEARTQALETASVAGGGILHGLEEQELIDYLGKALADGQLSEGRVTEKKFIEVLKNVPKVAMTEREARTIVTSVNKSEEGLYIWREFIPWSFSVISSMCHERVLHQSISEASRAGSHSGSIIDNAKRLENVFMREMMELAEKLLDCVKFRISISEDSFILLFPAEDATLRAAMVEEKMPPPTNVFVEAPGLEGTALVLLRKVAMMTMIQQPPPVPTIAGNRRTSRGTPGGSHARTSFSLGGTNSLQKKSSLTNVAFINAAAMAAAAAVQLPPVRSTVGVLLRIIVVDVPNSPAERELLVNIVAADSSFAVSAPLPVRLPTIALVDREAAEEFARNLVPRVYLELAHDKKGGPKVMLKEEEGRSF